MRGLVVSLIVGLSATSALAQSSDIEAKGGDGAIGKTTCTPGGAVPLQDCHFGISKNPDGTNTVRVLLPGGDTRILTFEGDKLMSSNSPKTPSVGVSGDWLIVTIPPEERIEISKSVLAEF